MTTRVHTIRADMLQEEDRILLKDLRVLTVRSIIKDDVAISVRHHELATDTRDVMVLAHDRELKILCEGRCPIDLAIADLI